MKPGTLARMEDGSRPGDPRAWGKLWQIFGLPLRELYEGLGLPVPDELPGGDVGEILELVRWMAPEAQRLVLSFTRHAPHMLVAAHEATNTETKGRGLRRVAEPPQEEYQPKRKRK